MTNISSKRKIKNLNYIEGLIETYQGSYLSKDGKYLLDEPMPRYIAKQAAIDELRKHGKAGSIDAMCAVSDESGYGNREGAFNDAIDYEKSTLANEDPSAEDVVSFKDTFKKLLAEMKSDDEVKYLCLSTRQSGTEHFLGEEHQNLIEEKLKNFDGKTDKDFARFLGYSINEEKNFSHQLNKLKGGFRDKARKFA